MEEFETLSGTCDCGAEGRSLLLSRETALEVDARLADSLASGQVRAVCVTDERGLSRPYLERLSSRFPTFLGPNATRRALAEIRRLAEEVRALRQRGGGVRSQALAVSLLVGTLVVTLLLSAIA